MFGWFTSVKTERQEIDIDKTIEDLKTDIIIPMPNSRNTRNYKLDKIIRLLESIDGKLE